MKKAAIIESGVVVNIAVVNDLSDLPGSVDGTGANMGDLWNGVSFSRPPAPILELLASKKEEIMDAYHNAMALSKSGRSDEEIRALSQLFTEAKAQRDNPLISGADIPLLTSLATERGRPVASVSSAILTDARAFRTKQGLNLGKKEKLFEAIAAVDLAAPDAADQLAAIVWV